MTAAITLHQPRRLIVGAGTIGEVAGWAEHPQSTLVIATPITAGFAERLKLPGKVSLFDAIPGEPDIATLDAALAAARDVRPDLIVGLGGGSVMDVAKLVAALWDGEQVLADVAGPNKVLGRKTKLVQIATTAGTGSEAGIRSLITDPVKGAKVAVESPFLIADLAILDPELTYSVPSAVTAATGVDAMAHCVEAFTSKRAQWRGYASTRRHDAGILLRRHLPRAGEYGCRPRHCLSARHAAASAAWARQCHRISACAGI
jgi:alcohol dehydrogenase class IV